MLMVVKLGYLTKLSLKSSIYFCLFNEIFLANSAYRHRLRPEHPTQAEMRKHIRRQELEKEKKIMQMMKKYKSKTIASVEQKAKEMGVSYGYYMAMLKGLGRVD
jgi:hypothetical protein